MARGALYHLSCSNKGFCRGESKEKVGRKALYGLHNTNVYVRWDKWSTIQSLASCMYKIQLFLFSFGGKIADGYLRRESASDLQSSPNYPPALPTHLGWRHKASGAGMGRVVSFGILPPLVRTVDTRAARRTPLSWRKAPSMMVGSSLPDSYRMAKVASGERTPSHGLISVRLRGRRNVCDLGGLCVAVWNADASQPPQYFLAPAFLPCGGCAVPTSPISTFCPTSGGVSSNGCPGIRSSTSDAATPYTAALLFKVLCPGHVSRQRATYSASSRRDGGHWYGVLLEAVDLAEEMLVSPAYPDMVVRRPTSFPS
ncbi:hypothetical protein R3P38DRAFT_3450296 [Favolaschia claudopus]|uniref:Uncharacterized protein n=1 Tax=Favolaschia claudopus TaxID=2862362 RepID=A0AAV9ZMF3_9AGAR